MMINKSFADRTAGHCTAENIITIVVDDNNSVFMDRISNGEYMVHCSGGATETYKSYAEAYKALWDMYDKVSCVCRHEQQVAEGGWHSWLQQVEEELEGSLAY